MAPHDNQSQRIPEDPGGLLARVISAVPATKYALGAAGILASAAIALGMFGGDARVTFLAATAAFLFATVTFIFARSASLRSASVQHLATFFVGFLTFVFSSVVGVLFSSMFFAKPLDLRWWIDPALKQTVPVSQKPTVEEQIAQPQPAPRSPPPAPVGTKAGASPTAFDAEEEQRAVDEQRHAEQLFEQLTIEDIRPSMTVFESSLKDDAIEATILFYYTAGPAPGYRTAMRYYERVSRTLGNQILTTSVREQQSKLLGAFARAIPAIYSVSGAVQGPVATSHEAWVEGFYSKWSVRFFIPAKNRYDFLFTDIDYRIGLTGKDDLSFRFPLGFTFWKVPPDRDPQPSDGVQNVTRGVFESQRFAKIDRVFRSLTAQALSTGGKASVGADKLVRRLGSHCEDSEYCDTAVAYMVSK